MIESFGDAATSDFFNGLDTARARKIPADIRVRAFDRLAQMALVATANELRLPPSNRLEDLKGSLKGYRSIRINRQWRIIFRWPDGAAGATEVRIDNHTY